MPLYTVVRGAAATADATFYNADGTPFVGSNPVQCQIFDHDRNFILGDSAVQDTINPARWIVTFTIPITAPISQEGKKYHISWLISGPSGVQTSMEYFNVLPEGGEPPIESAILLYGTMPFKDTLVSEYTVRSWSLTVQDEGGNTYLTRTEDEPEPVRIVNGYGYYECNAGVIPDLINKFTGIHPYLNIWNYTTDIGQETEVHVSYVMTNQVALYINDLRRYLDKARNYDINPALRFTDIDLAHFIIMGLQRLNGYEPPSTYTLTSMPEYLHTYLQKCAAVEALNAWYLAEGVSAFDFQGQQTQLTVDRTQYIQYKIEELNAFLEEHLKRVKIYAKRAGLGGGVLGVSVGPGMNYISRTYSNVLLGYMNRFM